MCATSKSVAKPAAKKIGFDTPIQYLKGVGPRIGALLNSRGITTVRDLLEYFPRDYQDRSRLLLVRDLKAEQPALLQGQILQMRQIPIRKLKRPMLEAIFQDSSGRISLKWFHYQKGFFDSLFKDQPMVQIYGQPRAYNGRLEILHPEVERLETSTGTVTSHDSDTPGLLPIYVEPEGLTQRALRKIIDQALATLATDEAMQSDDLPPWILKTHGLMPKNRAIQLLHRPENKDAEHLQHLRSFRTPEQKRIIFDDFFKFEWVVGLRRQHFRKEKCKAYGAFSDSHSLWISFKNNLPFQLTNDQKAAITKIHQELASNKPMNRLLQGDVGCGKTVVALASTLPVLAAGAQATILAPTEILAEQHYIHAIKVLKGLPIRVGLLVGSTPKAERKVILEDLAKGDLHLLIGTHALIEPTVIFKELGLVIIDEQHRFGVDQRMALRNKGQNPHMLSTTATPIPRTLALTAYGDLDVTTIKQLPAGRPAVHTKVIKSGDKQAIYTQMKGLLKQGQQAYVIYPLVEESEKLDLSNAIQGAEELANGPLAPHRVGLLHGKMKATEKQDIMDRFKKGEIEVLVSTTVVEVGVDVANATMMLIENAERFGLSQLHQLRGRVGRGNLESWCFLCPSAGGSSPQAYERLSAMEKTRDGFHLAELDLKIRGPGQFLGTRQSGLLQFNYADLTRDQEILIQARQAAFELLKNDPELKQPENATLLEYMRTQGAKEKARFETA
jgi:ATP-dependent DNA helicase RecG